MKSRSDRMYADSPGLQRDQESGKVAVKKMPKEGKVAVRDGSDGVPTEVHQPTERRDMHTRHMNGHMAIHGKHETEHAMHKGGDKAAMHRRHEAEMKDTGARHLAEMKGIHARHEKDGGKAA